MTSDPNPDFEKELFAAFGEPAAEWADDGATQRVMREIAREQRTRRIVMGASALAGGAISIGLLVVFAGPLAAAVGETAGAPPALSWAALIVAAAAFSWTASRLAVDA